MKELLRGKDDCFISVAAMCVTVFNCEAEKLQSYCMICEVAQEDVKYGWTYMRMKCKLPESTL